MINDREMICAWHEYAQHIELRCKNHPELRWHTKNISPIGCRTVFYDGPGVECRCPLSDLYHTCRDSEEYKKLEELG